MVKIGLQTDKNLGKLELDPLIFCLNFCQKRILPHIIWTFLTILKVLYPYLSSIG